MLPVASKHDQYVPSSASFKATAPASHAAACVMRSEYTCNVGFVHVGSLLVFQGSSQAAAYPASVAGEVQYCSPPQTNTCPWISACCLPLLPEWQVH